ncbi:hypothetical protein RISK_006332 [Rhodopirellula islandica]|uniref:Uncharacterized protein n=1 Tax=Rhodopirellula islandica TaxID=595434 RepID=A0A0J1B558_RHOIS|nr:hypothetical protein RISK_006332 [Rhodopirellula islandica]
MSCGEDGRFANWQGLGALSIECLDSRGTGSPRKRRTRIIHG